MSRRFPWKNKATDDDLQLIQRCIAPDPTAPTLFLLSEMGATQFILQSSSPSTPSSPRSSPSPSSVTKHRVMIGDTQRCTCGEAREGQRLCGHLLFVMIKVMRVKESDPLVWQLALTETEVAAVVKGRWQWKEERKKGRRQGREEGKRGEEAKGQAGQVQRKAVEGGDVCVVCQEEMMADDGAISLGLCWCNAGCGSALHARCMRVWAEHQAQSSSAITCPMCRSDWSKSEDFTLADLLQQLKAQEQTSLSAAAAPVNASPATMRLRKRLARPEPSQRCSGCRMSIAGHHPLYRCVHCQHQLCRACFSHYSTQLPHSNDAAGREAHAHTFVQRAVFNGAVSGWSVPTVGAAVSPSHLLQQLQSRELTTADYELLLQLDQRQRGQPLYVYLAASLPPHRPSASPSPSPSLASFSLDSPESPSDDLLCAFCSSTIPPSSQDTAASTDCRLLPCTHVAHHHCVSSAAMYDTVDLQCARCQRSVFPGLHSFHQRCRRPPRKATQPASAEDQGKDAASVPHVDLDFSVSGHQWRDGRLQARTTEEGKEQLSVVEVKSASSAQLQPARGQRHSRLGRPAQPHRLPPTSSLPSLPPIHLLSLIGGKQPSSSSVPKSSPDAVPPVRGGRHHSRSMSISALPAPAFAGAALHPIGSLQVTGAKHPQTAPLPTEGQPPLRGRLHRGLAALRRGGSRQERTDGLVAWRGAGLGDHPIEH